MANKINDKITVSSQISSDEVELIAAQGFDTMICNRPDGEEIGQPDVAEIEAEAKARGMTFYHVPIDSGQITPQAIEEFREALENSSKLFAYCRSGTRCAMLWSFSQKGKMNVDDILSSAADAGYDLSALRPHLEA